MIQPNTIIGGRYRVMKPLGGGGMKLVYLAEDLRLAARPCALAEMVDSFTSPDTQKQAVAAFQREADMLAQLSNEHIPRVFDRFSAENHHYLVMEYIDGITLEQKLKDNGGKLSEAEVIDIALQVLDTLEYLHNLEPPVIYRDLDDARLGQRVTYAKRGFERDAIDVLHHEVVAVLLAETIVDARDVLVV